MFDTPIWQRRLLCRISTTVRLAGLALLALCLATAASPSRANPRELAGTWLSVPEAWVFTPQADLAAPPLAPVSALRNTGGRYLYLATLQLAEPAALVIDFKNSSVIGSFRHHVIDARGQEVAQLAGGITSTEPNPFMLRHGRELNLPAGSYRIVTELASPFYLAHPEPYVDTLAHYRQAIKAGNALVLCSLGVMFALLVYYAALAWVRRERTDAMYAAFILGNLVYNGMALLVWPDLFGLRLFMICSFPILFSNIAYLLFASSLLGIDAARHPGWMRLRNGVLGLLALWAALAFVWPNWSLEFDRWGVGLIMGFGLSAGLFFAWRGNRTARLYLVAVLAFFVIGSLAITSARLDGIYTLYVEHIGLVAVTVEMVLLSLVLARQFSQLHQDKDEALQQARHNLQVAYTDALTGLPNRYALDQALAALPPSGILVFMDVDGLKFYNDRFGHQRGDALLRCFAGALTEGLQGMGVLHRIGGDEFAITCAIGDVARAESLLAQAVVAVRAAGFEFAGLSHGIASVQETADGNQLKHLADTRMYEHKRSRRPEVAQIRSA